VLLNAVIDIFPQIKSTIHAAITLYSRTTPLVGKYRLEEKQTYVFLKDEDISE
jgi:hypothetical protein